MASQSWPSSLPEPSRIERQYKRPALRNKAEDGKISTRKRWSKGRYSAKLIFLGLTVTEYGTLKTFFNTYQGLDISWTDVQLSETLDPVVLVSDSLISRSVSPDHVYVEIAIEEP